MGISGHDSGIKAGQHEYISIHTCYKSHSQNSYVIYMLNFLSFDSTAISIGFQFSTYTFFEPEFDTPIFNVTLIKEDNRVTEQPLHHERACNFYF